MTRAFDKIMAGLDDARAYLNGDRAGSRTGGLDRKSTNVMNPRFAELVTPLEAKCQKLLAMSPVEASKVPRTHQSEVSICSRKAERTSTRAAPGVPSGSAYGTSSA
jgi:hypothetical protein